MIALTDLFFSRDFASDDELIAAINERYPGAASRSGPIPPMQLMFFKDAKQRSYLFFYPTAMFCLTDNRVRNSKPKCQWRMSLAEALASKIDIWEKGYFTLGEHKPRRFTPALFTDFSLDDQISSIVKRLTAESQDRREQIR